MEEALNNFWMEVKFDIFENGRRPKKNQIKNKESKQPKTNKIKTMVVAPLRVT